jgi:hypothetical protein
VGCAPRTTMPVVWMRRFPCARDTRHSHARDLAASPSVVAQLLTCRIPGKIPVVRRRRARDTGHVRCTLAVAFDTHVEETEEQARRLNNGFN